MKKLITMLLFLLSSCTNPTTPEQTHSCQLIVPMASQTIAEGTVNFDGETFTFETGIYGRYSGPGYFQKEMRITIVSDVEYITIHQNIPCKLYSDGNLIDGVVDVEVTEYTIIIRLYQLDESGTTADIVGAVIGVPAGTAIKL